MRYILTGDRFVGRWIGESMEGGAPRAHLWEIVCVGDTLTIHTAWEGDDPAQPRTTFQALCAADGRAFTLAHVPPAHARGMLLDPAHFVIAGWDRSGVGHDVVFSRIGLAELGARAAWQAWRARASEARTR